MSINQVRPAWTSWCLVLALLKVILGLTGLVAGSASGITPMLTVFSPAIFVVEIVAFTTSAAMLVLFGAADRRAVHLGTVYLILASSFADTLIMGTWLRLE